MTALLAALLAASAGAQVPPVGPGAPVTAEALMKLEAAQLDELFANAPAGAIPDGETVGVANRAPGSGFGGFTREFFQGLWKGKTFDRARGTLTNRTAFGDTGSAKVYHGKSRTDGKPCIVLDYSESDNLLARHVYDEVRQVAPHLYLGIAYLDFPRFRKWLYFALEFPSPSR